MPVVSLVTSSYRIIMNYAFRRRISPGGSNAPARIGRRSFPVGHPAARLGGIIEARVIGGLRHCSSAEQKECEGNVLSHVFGITLNNNPGIKLRNPGHVFKPV